MKTAIYLKQIGRYYKVVKLSNMMHPEIGEMLSEKQVQDLLIEATRVHLTVHIS